MTQKLEWAVVSGSSPGLCSVLDENGDYVVVNRTKNRADLIAATPSLLSALQALHHLVSEVANPDAFNNGVYAPDGTCEGDVLAAKIIEEARVAIIRAIPPSIDERSHEYAGSEEEWR